MISKWARTRARLRDYVNQIKVERGCERCGYNDNPRNLQWHHVLPETKYKAVAEMRSAHFEVSRKINDKVIERFVEVETVVRNEKDYFKFVTEITMDNILIGKEVQEIQTKDVYYSKKDNFSPLSQYVKNYVLGNGVTPNYNFS